ncbi:RDD family protein [Streptomyces sp. NPDC058632]|uniref:RDD family protein n=1 Tax=unclassified Streptomyces TaxID=2593676 RepID=UPI00365606E2
MSAPTPAPGDDTPREGFYPDPSIPGYVRYWNGASWVPGTSRPAPEGGGAPLAPSASAGAASSGSAPAVPTVEETGPHFFDEDPVDAPPPSPPAASSPPSPSLSPSPSSPFSPSPSPADSQHGSRPEPASAWGADRSRQSGFGGGQDRRISWGADPRAAHASDPAGGASTGAGTGGADVGAAPAGNTFAFRPPTATSQGADSGSGGASPSAAPSDGATADEGTMTIRAVGPRQGSGAASSGRPGFGAGKAAAARAAHTASGQAGSGSPAAAPVSGPQQVSPAPAPAVPSQATAPAPGPAPTTGPAPVTAPAAVSGPLSSGHGGGQSSWAQQAHRPGDGQEPPVAPWKPPVEDVFQAAARRQAAARPAALGKRLIARLLDTVVLGGVTALAAVPLGIAAADHIDGKIDAAKLSGETVTVWLLDGTTSVYLGIVLAVLLLGGILYEVLPTAKWGRTLGKKLLGLEVRDIEGHDVPGFGAALRRWLAYSIPGLLVVGAVGVLWCLFDKPWRQCWHDKAAHTFVAG